MLTKWKLMLNLKSLFKKLNEEDKITMNMIIEYLKLRSTFEKNQDKNMNTINDIEKILFENITLHKRLIEHKEHLITKKIISENTILPFFKMLNDDNTFFKNEINLKDLLEQETKKMQELELSKK